MKKILIILILVCSGCNNYKELNNMAIVTGISIDYDNKYEINIIVSDDKNTVYQTDGKTISEALNKLNNIIPKQIYLGHLDMIILSENACNYIDNIINYFYRNKETSKQFHIIMTKNAAKDILTTLSKLEPFPFEKISLDINSNNSLSDNLTYNKYIETYLKKGMDPFIPTVKIYDDKYIYTTGLALFKNNKLVGYTNSEEAQGINLILNNNNKILIKNKYFIANIKNIKVKKKLIIKKNPTLYINVEGIGNIDEINNVNANINKKINSKFKKILNKSINITKKYNTDILGFGNLIYKKNPSYFYNHPNYLQELNIIIKTNIKVKDKNLIKEIKNEKME